MACTIKIDESRLDEYVEDAKDACLFTGLAYFRRGHDSATYMGLALLPSPFPRVEFERAAHLQPHWNVLFHKLARRPALIRAALGDLVETDPFLARLWRVYERVRQEPTAQAITLNIMRVDYFIDANKKCNHETGTSLSNIEINTLGVGGCAVPQRIRELHKYMLHRTGNDELVERLAPNRVADKIVAGLLDAWRLYANPRAHIVLVVRDLDFNFGDHRLIEYAIFDLEPSVKFMRMTLTQIHCRARIDETTKKLFVDDNEIALVTQLLNEFNAYPLNKSISNEIKLTINLIPSK